MEPVTILTTLGSFFISNFSKIFPKYSGTDLEFKASLDSLKQWFLTYLFAKTGFTSTNTVLFNESYDWSGNANKNHISFAVYLFRNTISADEANVKLHVLDRVIEDANLSEGYRSHITDGWKRGIRSFNRIQKELNFRKRVLFGNGFEFYENYETALTEAQKNFYYNMFQGIKNGEIFYTEDPLFNFETFKNNITKQIGKFDPSNNQDQSKKKASASTMILPIGLGLLMTLIN